MGFNSMQPGKVKPADLALFVAGIAVIAALVLWALFG
jgi:hypothetical protein